MRAWKSAPEATFIDIRNQRVFKRSIKRVTGFPLKSSFCNCRYNNVPR